MTTPGGTPPSSGTDIASLGISVDTKDAVTAASDLDALGKATVSVVKDLDALIAKADQEAAAIAKSTAATKQKIEALNAQYEAQQAALELDRQAIAVTNAQTQAGMNLIAKLEDLNLIYGLTTEQVYRLRAAQLDITHDAEPLIARLEQLKRAALESQVTQTRDLELWKERGKAYNEEQAAITKQVEVQKARDIEINAARQKDIVSYTKWWEDQIVIQDAAIAKQESALLAFSLFKSRTLAENAASSNLPAAINGVSTAAKEGAAATEGLSAAFGNNRVRTEALVLAHEALQGRFTRMPGSLMVMLEYINASTVALTGMTGVILGGIAVMVGLGYEVIKGIEQQKAFSEALIRTNDISGKTVSGLNAMADAAGKVHNDFSGAYETITRLARDGKFTGEQIQGITQAVLGLHYAFGTPLQDTIKEFESLSVKGAKNSTSNILEVSIAVEKLDEKYHFLNTTTLERIIQLEKEGKQIEASKLAVNEYTKEVQRAADEGVKDIGLIEKAWNAVWGTIKGIGQGIADIGKQNLYKDEAGAISHINKNKDGSLNLNPDISTHSGAEQLFYVNKYLEAEQKLSESTAKATAQAEKAEIQSRANHAAMQIAIEDRTLLKKSTTELTDAIARYGQQLTDLAAQDPNDPALKQSVVNERMQAIIKAHTAKEKAIKDDGRKQELLAVLDQATAEYNATVKANKDNEKLDTEYYKQGEETAKEYYANLKRGRQDEIAAADTEFEIKLAALNKYKARTASEEAERVRKIQEATNAHIASVNAIEDAQSVSDAKQKTEEDANYQNIIERTIKAGETEQAVLQKTIEAQKLHNAEIGKTAEYKEKAKKQATEELTLQYESDAAYLDQLIASKQYDEQATAAYQARATELHRIIELRKEDARLLQQGAQAEKEAAITKAAGDAWAKMDKKIEDDLISAIVDGGGQGVKKLIRDMEIAFAKLVLQPIIAPIASSIATLFNPNAPQATGAAGVAGAGGSIVGLINAANAAKTAYSALTSTGSGSIAAWLGGTSSVSPLSVAGANATGLAGGDSLGTLISMNGWSTGAAAVGGGEAAGLGGGVTAGTGALGTGATAGTGAELGTGLGGASSAGLGGGAAATGGELGTGLAAGAGEGIGAGAAAAGAGEGAAAGAGAAGAEGSLAGMGPYGWVALAVIAAFSLFGGGNGVEQNTHLKFANDNAPGNISINERGNQGQNDSYMGKYSTSEFGTFGVASSFWMNADQSVVQDFVKTVGQTDDALAKFLTTTEKASVVTELQGKTYTAQTGAESDNPNAKGQLDLVFKTRIHDIFEGIQSGLGSLIDSFSGTSSELATEAQNILSFRAALVQSGEAVFGEKVTLQQVAALRQPTENVGTALQRISQEFITTNQVATNLGKTSEQVYGQIGLSSVKAREQLILLTGGLDQLTSQTSFYAQNFLSDADKLKPVTAAVDTAMAALGVTGVETKAQFKTLVQGLDLTKESDIKLFESLMQLAPAFATNADAVAAISTATTALNIELLKTQGLTVQATELERQQQLSTLTGTNAAIQQQIYKEQDLAAVKKLQISLLDAQYNKEASTAIQRQDFLKSLDAVSQHLQTMIYALQDAYQAGDTALAQLQKSIEDKRSSLNSQYDADKQAIQDSADLQKKTAEAQKTIANDTLTSLTTVLSNINSAISSNDSSNVLTMQQRQGALTTLNQSLGVVNSGGSPAQFEKDETFNAALKTIAKPSSDLYSSFIDYSRDQAKANLVLAALKEKTADQVDKNQKIVDSLKDVSTTIEDASKVQLKELDKNHKADLDALDALLKSGQDSLDSLKGIDTGVKDLVTAIQNLQQAIGQIKATQSASNGDPAAAIKQLYESLLGRDPETAGAKFWLDAYNNGRSMAGIASDIQQSDEYKKLHPASSSTAAVTAPTVSPSGVPSSVVTPPVVTTTAATSTSTDEIQIRKLYETMLGREPEKAGLEFWEGALHSSSLADVAKGISQSAEYKKLHPFADGINEVPYDMTARIHEGERIMPKADNRELMSRLSQNSNQDAVVAEVKSMRLEIQGLRKENNDLTLTLVQSNANISKLATRWEGQGIPVRAVDPTQPIEVRTVV